MVLLVRASRLTSPLLAVTFDAPNTYALVSPPMVFCAKLTPITNAALLEELIRAANETLAAVAVISESFNAVKPIL